MRASPEIVVYLTEHIVLQLFSLMSIFIALFDYNVVCVDVKELELSPEVKELVKFSLSLLVPHVAQPPVQNGTFCVLLA